MASELEAGITAWNVEAELAAKVASPEYVAVIVFGPAEEEVKLHVAAVTVAEQDSVPSETVTVPVGVRPSSGSGVTTKGME